MTWLQAQAQAGGIPLPHPSPVTQPFWDGCRQERLLFQRCLACNHPVFEPSLLCRRCTGRELVWEESKGLGTVYSWTVAHRPQTQAFTLPYAPVIVDMDEGFQILSNMIECETDALAVGMRVRVMFCSVGSFTLPYFCPA